MADINITTWLYAFAGGVLPTFLWLWFWLSHDDHHEPAGLLLLTYVGGFLAVLILIPVKPFVEHLNLTPGQIIVMYAAFEEIVKFAIIGLIAFGTTYLVEAADYTIYLVTGALGFSALENTLYLISPLRNSADLGSVIITGNLRFLGATVLHTVCVALVGVIMGTAFLMNIWAKVLHVIIGLAFAIGLHTAFNHFIMQGTRQGTTIAIAGIWFVAVIVIILFDRLRSLQAHLSDRIQTA